MRIDVSEMTKYVGKKTLGKIEKLIIAEKKKGASEVLVDVTGLPLRMDFVIDIARLENEYTCKFVGLGEKEEQVDAIVSTGYFIKESLGDIEFGNKFKRLVEMADFPLMIKDNRRIGDELIIYNVIQPVSFDKRQFHYNVIKPYLLEPGELEKACWVDKKNIWDRQSIHISDIGEENAGFRFANTVRERTILDILTQIIEGTAVGFYEGGKVEMKEIERGKG